jgi:hypothetical protein
MIWSYYGAFTPDVKSLLNENRGGIIFPNFQSQFFQKIRIKELLFPVISKTFKNLQKLLFFMKKLINNQIIL